MVNRTEIKLNIFKEEEYSDAFPIPCENVNENENVDQRWRKIETLDIDMPQFFFFQISTTKTKPMTSSEN